MPRYYFTLQHRDFSNPDADGTVLPDDAAARDHARRIMRELKEGGG